MSGISNVCNVLWGFLILLICRRFALVQTSRHLNSSHSFATKEPPHLGHVSHCPSQIITHGGLVSLMIPVSSMSL
uniref:Secreted protein n=1 Tax=Marmota marmota marmota TaxID=9994 RepID=A0A8C6A7N5_MARMA